MKSLKIGCKQFERVREEIWCNVNEYASVFFFKKKRFKVVKHFKNLNIVVTKAVDVEQNFLSTLF